MIDWAMVDRVKNAPGDTLTRGPLVRPYLAADYVALHRLCALDGGRPLVLEPAVVGLAYEQAGPAFTAVDRDSWNVMGAAGLAIQYPGRATAWAILNPAMRRNRVSALVFHWTVKIKLRALIREHRIRRVEAEAIVGDGMACRWLPTLGFKVEGIHEAASLDGRDCIAFALVTRGV